MPVKPSKSSWIAPLVRRILAPFLANDANVSQIAGNAIRVLLIQVSGLTLAFLSQIALARWLGKADYGTYGLVVAWVALLAGVSNLGLPVSVLRFIPEYRDLSRQGLVRGLVQTSYGGTVTAALLATAAGLGVIFVGLELDQVTNSAFTLGLFVVPVLAVAELQTGMARAFKQVNLALVPLTVARPVLVAAGVFVVFAIRGSVSSVEAVAIMLGAIAVGVLWQGLTLQREWRTRDRPEYEWGPWAKVAFPLWLLAVCQIIASRADILLIGGLLTAEDVALYVAASRTAGISGLAITAVSFLAAPTLASLKARGRHEQLARVALAVTRLSFWPSVLVAIVLVAFSRSILSFFGSDFVQAQGALVVLVAGQLANAAFGAVGALLNVTGYQNDTVRVFVLTAIANVGLNYLLIPPFGILGAAVATSSTTALWNLWLHRLVRRRLGVRMWIFHRDPRI